MISRSGLISICLISLFALAHYYESRQDQDTAVQTDRQDSKQTPKKRARQSAKASPVDYQTIRPLFWNRLYANGGQSLYCGKRFSGSSHRGLNVEHVFPMSWATKALQCGTRKQCRDQSEMFNQIEADLHNLYPSRTDVNQDRSSFRFAIIAGEARVYGQNCDFEVDQRGRVVEPAPTVRGDIARSMFYMAYEYRDQGLRIFSKQAKLLANWHNADPPDDMERRRNAQIHRLQGNQNLFITVPQELSRLLKSGYFDN
ncbi:MAG: deoxyribonuclease-1 [Arenicella sp.]|jgi:deoxyribonuclease-1